MHDRAAASATDHTASPAPHDRTRAVRFDRACVVGAALVAFLVYAWTASDSPYWLDSGEFTAAAIGLDIAHPPGHPLAALWSGLFTLLPAGPLAYRVALSQAVAGALTVAALARAATRALSVVHLRPALASALGAAAALHFGASYALWFQSIRAEVYALQAMLVCFALERMSLVLAPTDDTPTHAERTRALHAASFALALGLANHHLIALLALPPLAYAWWSLGIVGIVRRTGTCLAIAAVGLSTYVYLPLRATADLPMNLGTPRDWARVWWVVSARVYARNMGTGESEPIGTRLADLALIAVDQLGAPVLFASLLGLYLGLRVPRTRRVAAMWALAALTNLGVRAWLGPIRGNPDMLGYMLPGLAALLVLATLGIALVLRTLNGGPSRLLPDAGWLLLPVLASSRFARANEHVTLARFSVTDALAEQRYRALPPNSVLVLTTPQATFLHWASVTSERLRPDVSLVPLPFLEYPGVAGALLARDPRLRDVIDGYHAAQQLPREALRALSRAAPVFVELDARETLHLYAHLEPGPAFARFSPEPVSAQALADGDRSCRDFTLLGQALAESRDDETRQQLLWAHYVAGLQLASGGASAAAAAHVQAARALNPQARELDALAAALANAHGPLDVRAFLPHDSGARAP